MAILVETSGICSLVPFVWARGGHLLKKNEQLNDGVQRIAKMLRFPAPSYRSATTDARVEKS
jgi:hypothetical protein